MSKRCIVCNVLQDKNENRSFHSFPRDINLRKKWLNILQITGQNLTIYNYICSDHFKPEEIYVTPIGRKLLRKGSVPSIFPKKPFPVALSYRIGSTSFQQIFQQTIYKKTREESTSQNSEGCLLTGILEKTSTETGSEIIHLDTTDSDVLIREEGTSQSSEGCLLTGILEKTSTETGSEIINLDTTDSDVLIRSESRDDAPEVIDLEQSPPRRNSSTDSAGSIDDASSTTETVPAVIDLEQSSLRRKETTMFLAPITTTEGNASIMHLINKKSAGFDNLTSRSTDYAESRDDASSTTYTAPAVIDLEQSSPRRNGLTDFPETRDDASSTTETASEVMDLMDLEQLAPRKRRRLYYYGDILPSDIDNPQNSRRSWNIIRGTIWKQKKEIKSLERTRRRLKERENSLKSLLKYLRETYVFSKNDETAIQDSLPGD